MTYKKDGNPDKADPVLILHSSEPNDKPRAAWFGEDQAVAATKLADKMGFGLIRLTTPAQLEIARLLEAGKVFIPGKGAVPQVTAELYAKVAALVGTQAAPDSKDVTAAVEASTETNSGTGDLPTVAERHVPILGFAKMWTDLLVGHLVIAQESLEDGWWEAVVLEQDQEMVTLRWRDYPKLPKFVRHRTTLALVSPTVS